MNKNHDNNLKWYNNYIGYDMGDENNKSMDNNEITAITFQLWSTIALTIWYNSLPSIIQLENLHLFNVALMENSQLLLS